MSRSAFRLAVVLVALFAGTRAAQADETGEGDAPEATQATDAPRAIEAPQVTDAAQPPEVTQAIDATEVPQAIQAPEAPQTSWYGWQTIISDTSVIGLWLLAYAVDDAKYGSTSSQSYEQGANLLVMSGFALYAFGGPAIHLAHGHGGKALGSLALRVGLPLGGLLAGLLVGSATCGPSNSDFISCPIVVGAMGLLVGAAAAPIVDAAVVARETVTPAPAQRLQAAFVPSGGGGTFLLGGRF